MNFINTDINQLSDTPKPGDLIKQGKVEEALSILDQNLTDALNAGDVAQAELVTAQQMGVAIELKSLPLLKEIRIMRLEVFSKTNQKMKAKDEYDKLKTMLTQAELEEVKALTGYSSEEICETSKPLLEEIDTYFVVDDVEVQNTGIKNSVLRKITLLEEEWGYRPTLVLSGYNQSIDGIIAHHQFYSSSRINTGMKVQNVYDYFQKTNAHGLPIVEHPRSQDGLQYKEVKANIFYVYDTESIVRQEFFTHPQNRLKMVQHLNKKGEITHMQFYDKNGYLSMVQEDDLNNKTRLQSYYTTDKNLCIKSKYILLKSNKYELKNIELYDDNSNVIGEGTNEADLVGFFLDQIAACSNRLCLFVTESGLYSKAMVNVNQKNAIKASVVHSAFLEDPYNLKSKPQMYFKDLIRYQNHFNGIVFLTKSESDDFIRIYGKPQRIFTVPNFYPNQIEKVDFNGRNHRKAVIVARFDRVKCLDVAVDIFKLVVEKLPDTTLEIYGYGSEEEERRVATHIKKVGMEKHVIMKGSTDRPDEVCSSAAIFMMTSTIEGMPLTLLESISNGCPAIAFDIKYGPADIIRNGKTGYIIPRSKNKVYAKQLIEYFNNIDLQRQMSENCYEDATRFSKEVFMENWYGFMEEIYHRHMSSVKPIG